jgi:Reverse transcriptase (RNA-dependent DNA polymerase).
MHPNTSAKVVSPDGETDVFKIIIGVLQADTLAPFLFVTTLDHTTRNSRKKTITDLDFADDIILISC